MRKYIFNNTSNEQFKAMINKKCFFEYTGGGARIMFESMGALETSRVTEIKADENKNISISTKNSIYELKRI